MSAPTVRRARERTYRHGADELIAACGKRHTNDLWFPEVKDGPTIFGSHLRIDGLAIAKSWSPVRITGYEVKVSRSDWVKDSKWEAYLQLCHQLYICAPEDVVHTDEVPEQVGIVRPPKTGERLRLERKAHYRAIEVPSDMLLYLLMSRTTPQKRGEYAGMSRETRMLQWEERLASKDRGKAIGYAVRTAISDEMDRLRKAAKREDDLATLDAWLSEHGQTRGWGELRGRLDAALDSRKEDMEAAANGLLRAAERARELLDMTAPSRIADARVSDTNGSL